MWLPLKTHPPIESPGDPHVVADDVFLWLPCLFLWHWWLMFLSDFIIVCFSYNLVFLLLFPGYRRYLLVLMKPWIQATWLLAQVTVSAFSHLLYHACAWEPQSRVTLSGWFYCCQVAVVLNKKAALGVMWRDACVCQNQHMLVWFVSVCCYES